MNEPKIGSMDDVMTSDERPIPQFTLRGNPKVEALMQQLRDLGVSKCSPVCRVNELTDIFVYVSRPYLQRGKRYSAKTLDAIGIVEQKLGYLVVDEVTDLVAETAYGGYQLLVRIGVFPAALGDDPSIVASVLGFETVGRWDDILSIEMR